MRNKPYYLVGGTESLFANVQVRDIQRSFTQLIQSYLPDNPVIWVSLDTVRRGLCAQVANAKDVLGHNSFVVTLSKLYFGGADAEISCTRVVDSQYHGLGLIARPQAQSLADQVADLVTQAGNRPIIVVDDTLFHGDTVGTLTKLGLPIKAAVEYFSACEAVETLEASGVRVFSACTMDDYLDVMPLHDFLPIMPLCGKIVGEVNGHGVQYLGCETGSSFSVPYIMPYIRPEMVQNWASIPYDNTRDFSAFALTQSVILAERMKMSGLRTIGDVKTAQQHRVSSPYLPGVTASDDVSLHDIIRRAVHTVMC